MLFRWLICWLEIDNFSQVYEANVKLISLVPRTDNASYFIALGHMHTENAWAFSTAVMLVEVEGT